MATGREGYVGAAAFFAAVFETVFFTADVSAAGFFAVNVLAEEVLVPAFFVLAVSVSFGFTAPDPFISCFASGITVSSFGAATLFAVLFKLPVPTDISSLPPWQVQCIPMHFGLIFCMRLQALNCPVTILLSCRPLYMSRTHLYPQAAPVSPSSA